jgi:hypothetical protein
MKTMLFPAVLMFAVCGASADDAVGRYQLVPVTRTINHDNGSSTEFKCLFKIDTVTGRTWLYSADVLADGKFATGWIEEVGMQ